MDQWFETLEDRFWLRPDEIGAEEAKFIKRALRLRSGQKVLDANGEHLTKNGSGKQHGAVSDRDRRFRFFEF